MSSARRDGQNHPFIWGPGQASIGRMTTPQTIQPSPAASTTNAPILMTREGELALREELARLREEVEVQLPKRLRQAREFGEASGNDDYLQILEEEAITTARINSLSRALAMARIIDPAEELEGVATVRSRVTMRVAGTIIERRLLGSHEPVGPDEMSVGSPIGKAIMGRSAGESVIVELPGGEVRSLEILAVVSEDPPSS